MKSAIIIGGGPSGCQCALWLKMLGHDVTIVEKTDKLGVLKALRPYTISWMIVFNNISEQEFAKNVQQHIQYMEIPILFNSTPSSIKRILQGFSVQINDTHLKTSHLVIATGVRARCGNI